MAPCDRRCPGAEPMLAHGVLGQTGITRFFFCLAEAGTGRWTGFKHGNMWYFPMGSNTFQADLIFSEIVFRKRKLSMQFSSYLGQKLCLLKLLGHTDT